MIRYEKDELKAFATECHCKTSAPKLLKALFSGMLWRYLDDLAEREVEVSKTAPFCEAGRGTCDSGSRTGFSPVLRHCCFEE